MAVRQANRPIAIDIDEQGKRRIAEMYRKAKSVDSGVLAKEMRKRLRSGALPAQRLAKASARGLPTRGHGSTGLRRRMARSIGTQVRLTGDPTVRVRLPRSKMTSPYGQDSLPQYANRYGSWRKRLFGTDVWTRQDMPGWKEWFDRPMRESVAAVGLELNKVFDDIDRRLKM